MEKTVLVSCVSKKLCHKARAEDLYASPWFELAVKYAKSLEPRLIFILSAKYGLTELSQEIDPYNLTLKEMGAAENKKWAAGVIAELRCHCDLRNDRFVILAGNEYRKYLVPHMDHVEIPLEGLRIGEQLRWLKEHC